MSGEFEQQVEQLSEMEDAWDIIRRKSAKKLAGPDPDEKDHAKELANYSALPAARSVFQNYGPFHWSTHSLGEWVLVSSGPGELPGAIFLDWNEMLGSNEISGGIDVSGYPVPWKFEGTDELITLLKKLKRMYR